MKLKALKLHREGQSLRAIEQDLHVSHATVANWLRNIQEDIQGICLRNFALEPIDVKKILIEEVWCQLHKVNGEEAKCMPGIGLMYAENADGSWGWRLVEFKTLEDFQRQ
jgi:hypothetical protein